MEEIYIKARAKVNLNLEIVGKRKDGYHNIESVFQKINLYDELYIQKTKTNKIEMDINIDGLNNKENIVYKAYEMLKERYEKITGVQVKLNKKIPMQAGLAGGSTDCASFILGMNQLFQLNLSQKEIEEIGKNLGADVVPCFYNKAVLVRGIGEEITTIDTKFKYYFVIIKPQMHCNTKEMYKRIDEQSQKRNFNYNTVSIIQALEQANINLLASNLYNEFEKVVKPREIIEKIKKELMEQGAIRKPNDWIRVLCLWCIFK